VQDIQRRLAAPCRNVSESTDLLDRTLGGSVDAFVNMIG